jgi:hypothetical protein
VEGVEGGALEKRGERVLTQKEVVDMVERWWVQGMGKGRDGLEKRGEEENEIADEVLVLLSELLLARDMEEAEEAEAEEAETEE